MYRLTEANINTTTPTLGPLNLTKKTSSRPSTRQFNSDDILLDDDQKIQRIKATSAAMNGNILAPLGRTPKRLIEDIQSLENYNELDNLLKKSNNLLKGDNPISPLKLDKLVYPNQKRYSSVGRHGFMNDYKAAYHIPVRISSILNPTSVRESQDSSRSANTTNNMMNEQVIRSGGVGAGANASNNSIINQGTMSFDKDQNKRDIEYTDRSSPGYELMHNQNMESENPKIGQENEIPSYKFAENLKILKNLENDIEFMQSCLLKNISNNTNNSKDIEIPNNLMKSEEIENGSIKGNNPFQNHQHHLSMNAKSSKPKSSNICLNSSSKKENEGFFENLNQQSNSMLQTDIEHSPLLPLPQRVVTDTNINNTSFALSNDKGIMEPLRSKIRGSLLFELELMLDETVKHRRIKSRLTKDAMEDFMKRIMMYYKMIVKSLANMQHNDIGMMLLILMKIITIQFEDMYVSYFIQLEVEKQNPNKKYEDAVKFYRDKAEEQKSIFERKEMRYELHIQELKKELEQVCEDRIKLEKSLREANIKHEGGITLKIDKITHAPEKKKKNESESQP